MYLLRIEAILLELFSLLKHVLLRPVKPSLIGYSLGMFPRPLLLHIVSCKQPMIVFVFSRFHLLLVDLVVCMNVWCVRRELKVTAGQSSQRFNTIKSQILFLSSLDFCLEYLSTCECAQCISGPEDILSKINISTTALNQFLVLQIVCKEMLLRQSKVLLVKMWSKYPFLPPFNS